MRSRGIVAAASLAACFVPTVASAQVDDTVIIINEILVNPVGTDNETRSEWIEIFNNGNSAVDLTSYTLIANNAATPSTTILPEGSVIQPKGFLILAGNKGTFLGEYHRFDESIVVDLQWPRGSVLHNTNAGRVELIKPGEGTAFESVFYQIQTAPWPIGTSDSFSIELNSPVLDNTAGGNWTLSPELLGSPGRPNSPLNTGGIAISGGVRDKQYPTSTDDVIVTASVSGTFTTVELLRDSGAGYVATAMTSTGGGNYTANLGTFASGTLVKTLVRVTDANGYYQTEPYLAPECFYVDNDPVDDTDIVINEIMYNSQGSDNATNSEWIEFYNRRATPVNLSYFMTGNHLNTPNARVIGDNSIIPANGYFIFAGHKNKFLAQYPLVDPSLVYDAKWAEGSILANSNTNQDTPLVHANSVDWYGTRVPFDVVPWRVASPWPTDADGLSIQLKDPALDNTVAENWVQSSAVGEETPAAANVGSAVGNWSMY